MTADSMPVWSEIQHIKKQLREEAREEETVATIRVTGILAMIGGIGTAVVLTAVALADGSAMHARDTINPLALTVGVCGVVLLAVSMLTRGHRRRYEAVMSRLSRLEEHLRHHDEAGDRTRWPATDDEAVPGNVVAIPNPQVYQLGIEEGMRRARDRRPRS